MQSLPSFSVVVETFNLSAAEQRVLIECLDALAEDRPSARDAEEVVLVENGHMPDFLTDEVAERYPWADIIHADPATGYYGSKNVGAAECTDDVVVLLDSDCVTLPGTLEAHRRPFAEDPDVAVVTGQTSVRRDSPYSLAIALSWIFPPHEEFERAKSQRGYNANCVAFSRDVLESIRIPTDLPLSRGNCLVHAKKLSDHGFDVLVAGSARAYHAPPEPGGEFVRRWFQLARDGLTGKRLQSESGGPPRLRAVPSGTWRRWPDSPEAG